MLSICGPSVSTSSSESSSRASKASLRTSSWVSATIGLRKIRGERSETLGDQYLRRDYFFFGLPPLTSNGFVLTVFRIAPLRMHWVQTRIVLFVPLGNVTWTFCRLGTNLRRVIPVFFVPTPPRYFALPRVSTRLPIWTDLLQASHCRAMAYSPLTLRFYCVFG